MHTDDVRSDPDANKGAVENPKPGSDNEVSLSGQLPHRGNEKLDGADSDFPEPGAREEHSGEDQRGGKKPAQSDASHEGAMETQEPGFSQKTNQNQQKEDPLAS